MSETATETRKEKDIETVPFEEIKKDETAPPETKKPGQSEPVEDKQPQGPEDKTEAKKFDFTNTDKGFNDFLKEQLNIPKKQDPQPGEKPDETDENPETKTDEPTAEPEGPPDPDLHEKIGNSYFFITNSFLLTMAEMIAGDGKKPKIGKEEERELKEAWIIIAQSSELKKLPAWAILLVVMPVAYGPIFLKAAKARKEKAKAKKYPFKEGETEKSPTVSDYEPVKNVKIPTKLKNGRYSKDEQRYVDTIREAQEKIDKQNEVMAKYAELLNQTAEDAIQE